MMDKKTSLKQARNKVPQKQRWRVILKALLLLVWVAAAVIAAQLIVGYLMLWILGRETFTQPVPTAIYSALSYILALLWIIFITPKITVKLKIENELRGGKRKLDSKISPKAMGRDVPGQILAWRRWALLFLRS